MGATVSGMHARCGYAGRGRELKHVTEHGFVYSQEGSYAWED